LDNLGFEIRHGRPETVKLDTPYPKIGMANLKSHKLYTLDLEIGHGKSETFKLDTPNLEIGHYKHMILQI
jgi:hypothetical protein